MTHAVRSLYVVLAFAWLVACSGGGAAPTATNGAMPAERSQRPADVATANATACTPIKSVNPNTDFPNDPATKKPATALRFEGGDGLTLDATGCTYGIYLSPASKELRIDHAVVAHASRVAIFAEDVSGVSVDHTVVNGTSFGLSDPTSRSRGGIAFRGASGTVDHARVFNTTGFGINIVANNSCFGVGRGTCYEPNVSVDHSTIDNSATTGDGIDVIGGPYPKIATASISHSTAIGSNASALRPGQFDPIAQAGFGFVDAAVATNEDTAVDNQVGFDAFCATGIASLDDLAASHDRVTYDTPLAFPLLPLAENQVLNVFSFAQLEAAIPGYC